MGSKVSTLTVSLKDDVSGTAGQIGRALKQASDQARAMAQAMNGSGASRGFVNNLARLGLSAKDIEKVAGSLKDYARANGLAAKASDWTKADQAKVRAWESATIASLRHVSAEQKAFAQSNRDMIAGMGSVGRVTAQQIAASRRMIDGMGSAQSRKSQEMIDRAQAQAVASADARRALVGMGGLYLGHKVNEGTRAVGRTYRDFDKYKRQTQAFGNFDDAEMSRIVDMAIHGGASTRYNDIQWLQGAKALGGRGVKASSVMGILPEAAQYGQAMSTDLPEAVAGLEGSLFAFRRDLSTPESATAAARRTADLQVAAAKAFGLTHHDLKGGYEYGALGAEMTGLGEEKLLAFLGLGKKLNIDGITQGNAWRAMTSKFLSPTRKGREALAAAGVDYSKRQMMPERLSVDNFANMVAQQYGVKLNGAARGKLDAAFSNKDVFTNASSFALAVKGALQGQVGINSARDANKVVGSAERFRQVNVEKVDVNGLLDDVMGAIKGGNLALANAIFGEKQGNRIMAALRDGDVWRESVKKIEDTPEGKAKGVADKMNAGFDGAASRFEGAVKNLETAAGRAWDDDGKGGFLTGLVDAAAKATQALAELPTSALQAGSALAWLGGKAATYAGTAALIGASLSLKGSAVALTAAAARLAGPKLSDIPGGDLKGAGDKGKMGKLGLLGALGLPALGALGVGYLLSEYGDPDKSVNGTGGRPDFGMNPSDVLPGLPGSNEKPSWAPKPDPVGPNAPAQKAPHEFGSMRRVPLPPSRPDGLGSASPVPLPPSRPVEFKVEAAGADTAKQQLGEVKAQADAVAGTNVSVAVSAPGANGVISQLQQIISLAGQAKSAAESAGNAAVAGIRARARANPSLGDGITPGAGS